MLSAILFDFDGTIVNTDPIHYRVWKGILLEYGIEINEKIFKSDFAGRHNDDIIRDVLPHLSAEESQKFAIEKEAIFRQQAPLLEPINGFDRLFAWCKQNHIKCALVTNAPKLNANYMLEALELKDAFDLIILGEEQVAAKPHPIPYQVALEKLGVTAQQAIAIEDSPSGMRSAVSAGVPTVGIASTQIPETLHQLGAFMVISDFADSQLWKFLDSHLSNKVEVN